MSKLNQEELLKILGDSIEEGRRNIRDLKGSLDISQDEFYKRFYDLNRAEQQIREMIQKPRHDEKTERELQEMYSDKKPEVTEEFVEKWANIFATSTLSDGGIRKEVKEMLKEAGYKVAKPVTEEWIEEKAKIWAEMSYEYYVTYDNRLKTFKGFIRSLVEKIK